jgi:hypothetical protein
MPVDSNEGNLDRQRCGRVNPGQEQLNPNDEVRILESSSKLE